MTKVDKLLCELLRRSKIDLSKGEIHAQDQVEQLFIANEYDYVREQSLGHLGRIDFVLPRSDGTSLGIEMKMSGASRMAIFKQIQRYTESEDIDAIILLTNTAALLPPEHNGTRLYVCSLGAAWL